MQTTSKLLKSPLLLELDAVPQIRGVFSYIVRHYGDSGLSVLYERDRANDTVFIQFGDWAGNVLDVQRQRYGGDINNQLVVTDTAFEWDLGHPLKSLAHDYYNNYAVPLLAVLSTLGIWQAQLYLTMNLVLVDIQISVNKLAGPGMLKELFSKTISTQEILKIESLDNRAIEQIKRGTGTYSGDLIIKPSAFKHVEISGSNGKPVLTPMYVQVCR